MSMIGTLKDLLKLGYPVPDSNGALQAQVALRRAPLATLLAVVDAADGEVAIATDQDAFVIYQGDPSVGVPYFPRVELSLFCRSGVLQGLTRQNTPVPFDDFAANNVSGNALPYIADSGYIEVPNSFPDKEYVVEYSFRSFNIFQAEAGTSAALLVNAGGTVDSADDHDFLDLPASGEIGPVLHPPTTISDAGSPITGNNLGLLIWNNSYTTDFIVSFKDFYFRMFSIGDEPT